MVLAGPSSGNAAAPTFRALVAADIPALAVSKITAGTSGYVISSDGSTSAWVDSSTLVRGKISATAPISYNNSTGVIAHNTTLTSAVSSGLYKVAVNTYGHITGTAAVTASDLPSHTHSYTQLTGSTTVVNQAIVSNGTANGWKLLTLGSIASADPVGDSGYLHYNPDGDDPYEWLIPPNDAVKQTPTTTSASYEVLFSYTASNADLTEGARKNSNLLFNPSTGNLQTT